MQSNTNSFPAGSLEYRPDPEYGENRKHSGQSLLLWYDSPSEKNCSRYGSGFCADNPDEAWYRALPIGNGRLGAMVYGNLVNERIQLNEDTVWAGSQVPVNRKGAYKYIEKARKLFFEGKYEQAEKIVQDHVMSPHIEPRSYQPLGDLILHFGSSGDITGYRRELDLDTAVTTVTYKQGGKTYLREAFASPVDQVIAVYLACDKPAGITVDINLNRVGNAKTEVVGSDRLLLQGQASHGEKQKGVRFTAVLHASAAGGRTEPAGGGIRITDADSVVIYIAAATDYNMTDPSKPLERNLRDICMQQLSEALKKPYGLLKETHISEHRRLFRRAELCLVGERQEGMPTDKRLELFGKNRNDNGLIELYFQFGRYLLICSSRPGSMPANLQGIWNAHLCAPWNADYHININIQMNYWPAQVTNLSECQLPYFTFLESLVENARETARDVYGCGGIVAHYTTDAWHFTAPSGKVLYGMWVTALGWCSRDFIEYYRFNGDMDFLRERTFPFLKEVCSFFLDWLVEDPESGRLVSGPASSPENSYVTDSGKFLSLCMGPSMDQQIIAETFSNFLEAAKELNIAGDFENRVRESADKLAVPKIASDGRLMEWPGEFKETEPGHRHISHLYAVHPSNLYTCTRNTGLFTAARKSLEYRLRHGGGHTGWSRAWIINFMARFKDAEKACGNLASLLSSSTLPNLFDIHPPFQIDGNFGGAAGIAEMLVQSHDGMIELLPALPDSWKNGYVKGLMARGGFEADIFWENGRLSHTAILSRLGNPCRISYAGHILEFETARNKYYKISFN